MSEKKKTTKRDNKIIPFQFEENEQLDQELDEQILRELMKEADELEEQLNNDPDLMGMGASDDLFLKIVGELKKKGVWEEEDEESCSIGIELQFHKMKV